MKRLVSVVVFAAIICSVFTAGVPFSAISYDNKLTVISDDKKIDGCIIRDSSENNVLIDVESDCKEFCTDIAIDMRNTSTVPYAEAQKNFSNKTKIYVLGTDVTKISEYLSDIMNKHYGFAETEINIDMTDNLHGFIGCSIELIDTEQTVFTYYFDEVHVEPDKQLEYMLQSDSSKLVYDNMEKYKGISQLNVYSNSSYYKIIPTIVHTNTKSELQSIYYFNRLAVGQTETLWDINNIINVTPKGEYQTLGINCWLNVGTAANERLIGFGPSATVNSSSTSYTVSGQITSQGGDSIGANRSYSISLADIQCEPTYSSANGTCRWNYVYTAGTTSAKGASTVSSTVRVANSRGQIAVYPEINYIIAEVYWLFGYHYSTSSTLYLSSALPSRQISFNDIQ